jgi:predicted CopG family antitoxin
MHKRVNICVNHKVYAKLRDRGKFGESFSDLISRILEESEKIGPQTEPLKMENGIH